MFLCLGVCSSRFLRFLKWSAEALRRGIRCARYIVVETRYNKGTHKELLQRAEGGQFMRHSRLRNVYLRPVDECQSLWFVSVNHVVYTGRQCRIIHWLQRLDYQCMLLGSNSLHQLSYSCQRTCCNLRCIFCIIFSSAVVLFHIYTADVLFIILYRILWYFICSVIWFSFTLRAISEIELHTIISFHIAHTNICSIICNVSLFCILQKIFLILQEPDYLELSSFQHL